MTESYEIHSILEFGDNPTPGLWWVLSPSGDSPPIRAGAECLIKKCEKHPSMDGSIILSGGATPHGYIDNVTELSLFNGSWKKLPSNGLTPRYEHVMVEANDKLVVLLGSSNTEPPTQELNGTTWSKSNLSGSIPSARAVSQTGRFNGKTYIWSGGSITKSPITDTAMYVVENGNVKKEKLSGEIPPPVQEFAMCADDSYIYIHGGLSLTGKSSDLYRINRKTFRSKRCNIEGSGLKARAMHKMVQYNSDLYIFGGLTESEEVSDELFRLRPKSENSLTYSAQNISFETKPTPRLAFNFAVVNMPVKSTRPIEPTSTSNLPESDAPVITPIDDWKVTIDGQNVEIENQEKPDSNEVDYSSYHPVPLLLIHGGCDAQGEFFNDIYVSTIPN